MNEQEALRAARLFSKRQEQDRIFKRNAHIRQKIYGVLICLFSLASWWYLSEVYAQFEHGLIASVAFLFGVHLILTKRNYPWEMRDY